MPKLNITLQHNDGTVSSYGKTDAPGIGIREAILVCMDLEKAASYPFGVVRADLPGSSWSALVDANAIPAVEKAMIASASEVLMGFIPKLYFDIDSNGAIKGAMSGGRLVTTNADSVNESQLPGVKGIELPRDLPYQIGGDAEGAYALLYKPEGARAIEVHSIHPTVCEATLAEEELKVERKVITAVLRVSTPVTRIVAAVIRGLRFDAPNEQEFIGGTPSAMKENVSRQFRSSMNSPTPFTAS